MHFIGNKRPYDEWQILSKSCDEGPSTLSTWPFLTFFNRPLLVAFRDEKSTLLSQISTLQAQQAALEIRLESVSQTADNAMEREREAEDRLDAALSMHARQLTQRQVSHIACVSMYQILYSANLLLSSAGTRIRIGENGCRSWCCSCCRSKQGSESVKVGSKWKHCWRKRWK